MQITEQDKKDIEETMDILHSIEEYIGESADHDFDENHKTMCDAIGVAREWLDKLTK